MGRKRESLMVPFLIKAANSRKYASCLVYIPVKKAFAIHLPRKSKISCATCIKLLKDWNSRKRRNINDADYSNAKHAILIALNKSFYVERIPENVIASNKSFHVEGISEIEDYCWYRELSLEEKEEKRERKKRRNCNSISSMSPCSEDESEIPKGGCCNFILSQSPSSEGYGSSIESQLPADQPSNEIQSPYNASNFSGVESGIDSPMPFAGLNSATSDNFGETYHNLNEADSETSHSMPDVVEPIIQRFTATELTIEATVSLHQELNIFNTMSETNMPDSSMSQALEIASSVPETNMEIEFLDQGFEAIVQADDDILNLKFEHIMGNVLYDQQFEALSNKGVISRDTTDKVLQEWRTYNISEDDWNSVRNYLYTTHPLRNEKDAKTDKRLLKVMYYKLSEKIPLEETVLLTFKPMGEVPYDTDSKMPQLYLSRELDCYEPFEITPNTYGYFKVDDIQRIQASQITEIKHVEGHVIFFLKFGKTISPRNYFPNTGCLN